MILAYDLIIHHLGSKSCLTMELNFLKLQPNVILGPQIVDSWLIIVPIRYGYRTSNLIDGGHEISKGIFKWDIG